MEEWTVLCANSAEATASAAMRMASEMRMTADSSKDLVCEAYKHVTDVEDAYNNPASIGFRDAGGDEFDITLAEALHTALDIASGANNGANITMLANRITQIYRIMNESGRE